ncbi:MAG: hypothetical protein KAH84_11570 [Thiomargarita sp.]|nr:hypothetical protein [Thiomargarita sp.]
MTIVSGQSPDKQSTFNTSIKFISSEYFTGCNLYHQFSVLRRGINFGMDNKYLTAGLADSKFVMNFINRFTSLKSLIPQNGLKNKFITRLKSSQEVGFEELLLEAILAVDISIAFAMHNLHAITYANIEKYEKHTHLIWNCAMPKLSQTASEVALIGILELLPEKLLGASPEQEGFATAFKNLQDVARGQRLSSSTAVLKLAAQKRGLPYKVSMPQHLRLGQGAMQQQLYSSMTSRTSITAQKVCANKQLTNQHLRELRLPTSEQIAVNTLDAAYIAAKKLGFPLVIKPLKFKEGISVNAKIATDKEIKNAFELAQESGKVILMEHFEPGQNHRLLIIDGKFAAALMRKPPIITGDGQSTVEQLIDKLNANPLRDDFRLYQLKKNAELFHLLKMAELNMHDTVPEGREIALRSTANVSTGGLAIDITEQVHPDNRKIAERMAIKVGLDVAGIDFITTDITRSYRDIGGVITELNAQPELGIHTWPQQGKSQNVAGKILNLFYPAKRNGRIPIIAIAGDKGTGTTARMLNMILRGAGQSIALALRKRAFVNDVLAELSDSQQRQAPLFLLSNPQIDTLITTVSPRQTTSRGLLFEKCTMTIIMNKHLETDTQQFHLGLDIIERATTDCFVIGAGNIAALSHLKLLGSRRLILVSDRINDPTLQSHLNAGCTVVTTMWVNSKMRIVVLSGKELKASFNTLPRGSRDGRTKTGRLKNGRMFAIAAAFGMGLSGSKLIKAFENAPDLIEEIV